MGCIGSNIEIIFNITNTGVNKNKKNLHLLESAGRLTL